MDISSARNAQKNKRKPSVATVWWIVGPNGPQIGQKLTKNWSSLLPSYTPLRIPYGLLDSPLRAVPAGGPCTPGSAGSPDGPDGRPRRPGRPVGECGYRRGGRRIGRGVQGGTGSERSERPSEASRKDILLH